VIIIKATKYAIFPHPLRSLGNDKGHVEKLPRVGESGVKGSKYQVVIVTD